MKKKLTLLIFLLPLLVMAQTTIKKDGTITFDLRGKKAREADTLPKEKEPSLQPEETDEDYLYKKKDKKPKGSGYVATSNTSLTIETGDQNLTTQAGLSYLPGDRVKISNTGGGYLEGTVVAYSGTSMEVSVTRVDGTGTYDFWNLDIVRPSKTTAKSGSGKGTAKADDGVDVPDYKKDGIFKAILHAGINGAQIDGDGYAGYNLIGADVGVGTLIRFHKYFSASIEINYTMKGAKQKLNSSGGGQGYDSLGNQISLFKYRANLDYVEVPIAVSVQDKKYIRFSLGLSIAALIRYREQTEAGQDDTNKPPNGQPKKFDFCGFGALDFIIHKNFMLGIKFSYSLISLRGPQYPGLTRLLGEYNNVLNFHFAYIMDKSTFKKKH